MFLHGIEPDETNVSAINNMPAPQFKKDLQRCLGMINYVGKFVPSLSVKTTAMRSLLENKNDWNWSNEHKKEFHEIKRIPTSKPVLQFYDAKKKSDYPQTLQRMGWKRFYCGIITTTGFQQHMLPESSPQPKITRLK